MAEIIRLANVAFTAGEKQILKDINFAIEAGARVSISGPSGSGKSTILKLISGLISPTAGTVSYNGQNIAALPFPAYRQQVSYCFQTPGLFGETVQDNLEFPALIRQEKLDLTSAARLLAEVGLDKLELTKKINSLSGGERQRVALIRNLLYPPQVLLLDEITASLDNETSAMIWRWLFKQAKATNMTLIWVSHKQNEVDQANHHIIINDGVIAAERKG